MNTNYEMLFERTVQSFLGEKAFHIAGQVHTEKNRKEWYQKILKFIIKKTNEIDTNTKHKEDLLRWSEKALKVLSEKPYNELPFTLCLLRLIASLLGLQGLRPYNIATPAYFQTPSQHYTEIIASGGDTLQDYIDEKNTISTRRRIIKQLKKEKLTNFEISLVMNISEYQVNKLLNEL